MSRLENCPTCDNPTSENAEACPKCGEPLGANWAEETRSARQRELDKQSQKTALRKKEKSKRRRYIILGILALLITFPLLHESEEEKLQNLKENNPEEYQRVMDKKAFIAKDEKSKRAKAEEAKRKKGFHCLNTWDGSHNGVKSYVEKQMRDPDSFEHIETKITPVDKNGYHALIMQYRAKNGFGGMTVGTATARIKNADCSASVLSIN